MTKEEMKKKAKEYAKSHVCFYLSTSDTTKFVTSEDEVEHAYRVGFNAGYTDGYEVGKKNECELQCGKKHLENLAKENEALKKSALVWHKVTCFDKPDENGYITTDNPAEEGKEYLLKTKYGFDVDTLEYDDTGFFFKYDWSEIEAWAELPERN